MKTSFCLAYSLYWPWLKLRTQLLLPFMTRLTTYNLQNLILIAIIGEWWRFQIVVHKDYGNVLGFFCEEQDSDIEEQKKRKKVKRKDIPKKFTTTQSWWYDSYEDFGSKNMVKLERNAKAAMPPQSIWSNNILFGSPASNQRFYLIHRLMEELWNTIFEDTDNEAFNLVWRYYLFFLNSTGLIWYFVFRKVNQKMS